ncbi:hypothetical protein BDN72DRAFT_953899 [Pluteus cervinus]|uniref:Uncharacterized protein n=1 Tax=Pluteus cervinus TaxID=181527 RepID=A0ACD3BHX6_9AGAR|nr:hypothetical protein BDN72DRAFT_953899 [Pluteus cervinus]
MPQSEIITSSSPPFAVRVYARIISCAHFIESAFMALFYGLRPDLMPSAPPHQSLISDERHKHRYDAHRETESDQVVGVQPSQDVQVPAPDQSMYPLVCSPFTPTQKGHKLSSFRRRLSLPSRRSVESSQPSPSPKMSNPLLRKLSLGSLRSTSKRRSSSLSSIEGLAEFTSPFPPTLETIYSIPMEVSESAPSTPSGIEDFIFFEGKATRKQKAFNLPWVRKTKTARM